jgi:hypothetical protein
MRNKISHTVYGIPRYVWVFVQWFIYALEKFPYMLTDYLKAHNASIESHNTSWSQHEFMSGLSAISPLNDEIDRL